jgi:hypothetical protein
MARLFAAGLSGTPCFRAAEVLCAWQFVAAVIDHIMAGNSGRNVWLQFIDLHLHKYCGGDQKGFQDVGGDHDPQRNQAKRSFSCQPGF